MKNKILAFGLCVAVFLGLFGFAVSASSADMKVLNIDRSGETYTLDVLLDAQSVSGYLFVAGKNSAGVFSGVQVYDAATTMRVEVSKEAASATIFWWDVFNTMKPMVKQLDVKLNVTQQPVLNDIEDGGLLTKKQD